MSCPRPHALKVRARTPPGHRSSPGLRPVCPELGQPIPGEVGGPAWGRPAAGPGSPLGVGELRLGAGQSLVEGTALGVQARPRAGPAFASPWGPPASGSREGSLASPWAQDSQVQPGRGAEAQKPPCAGVQLASLHCLTDAAPSCVPLGPAARRRGQHRSGSGGKRAGPLHTGASGPLLPCLAAPDCPGPTVKPGCPPCSQRLVGPTVKRMLALPGAWPAPPGQFPPPETGQPPAAALLHPRGSPGLPLASPRQARPPPRGWAVPAPDTQAAAQGWTGGRGES